MRIIKIGKCIMCPYYQRHQCGIKEKYINWQDAQAQIPEWCPLENEIIANLNDWNKAYREGFNRALELMGKFKEVKE